jgi:uncharacterized protein
LPLLMTNSPIPLATALFAAAACACGGSPTAEPLPPSPAAKQKAVRQVLPDPILVIGSGIAGLSAATEAASAGARVQIIDRSSVFGGHAVAAGGGVTLVNTPLQRASGITDTPALATADFLAWGKDPAEDWVRRYAEFSGPQVYQWLTAMGVEFTALAQLPGNRVARYHRTRDAGLGLVAPLFRNAIALGAEMRMSEDVVELVVDEGRVIGVRTRGIRDGRDRVRRATAVILATGGFQSDLERVRLNWPRDLPVPQRLLSGAGRNARGSGLDLATKIGARLDRMDHQWNYVTGLPDPRAPDGDRGLSVEVPQSIWVNRSGRRFVDERSGTQATMRAVLRQPGGYFYAILDADGARAMAVAGTEWADRARVEREILRNPSLVTTANDLYRLAREADIPIGRLRRAIAVHNAGRSGFRIERAPFYAIRMYPLTRKSMGGLAVNDDAQVLNQGGDPIAGLYAAGEVTGFAGVNGRAALEGTFLGPSVLMGRIAGRSAAADAPRVRQPRQIRNVRPEMPAASYSDQACTRCHPIQSLALERSGWAHLAAVHRRVRNDSTRCADCHPEMHPYREQLHSADQMVLSLSCRRCHAPR